jgi:hypothetical protein
MGLSFSRPTPHRRQSILNGFRRPTAKRKSDLERVLLSELDGKECGLQKQCRRQDGLNREKGVDLLVSRDGSN